MSISILCKLEKIAKTLRQARTSKGYSQRTLSQKIGIPQSHISNIENGTVDLKTSNLIELARTLDFEVILIPRTLINTVLGLTRQAPDEDAPPADQLKEDDYE